MKKLKKLTKTLLIAVLLGVGVDGLWATDYKAVWQQTFDGDDYASGWSITPTQALVSGTDYAVIFGTGNNSSSGSISYANNTKFSNATYYSFEFDYGVRATHSNGGTNTVTINANNSETKLLSISTEKGATTTIVYNAAGTSVGTFTNETYTNPKSLPSADKIYHFKITADATNGVYLVVTNSASSTVIARTRIANFGQITGISVAMGRYWATVAFNNFVLSYDIDPYKTRATAATTAYTAIKDAVMNGTVKTALESAKNALDAFADDDDIVADIPGYVSAIAALETANENAQTSANNFSILNTLIGYSKPTGYVAPSGATEVYTSNADVDPVALTASVREAIITAGTVSNNTDISALIANKSFELGSSLGWTIDMTQSGEGINVTDGILTIHPNGNTVSQTIGTLPAGRYTLSAKAWSNGAKIYLIMNDTHNDGTIINGDNLDVEYSFTLSAETEVTIGINSGDQSNSNAFVSTGGGWWYRCDNFVLTYVDEDPLGQAQAALDAEIDDATDVKDAWTPRVGTTPFKYASTYYDALVSEIAEANAVKVGGSETVKDYTDAKDELEAAKEAMASSVLNLPAADKYYRLYLAEDGASTGKNLNMLENGSGKAVLTATPYPVKFVASGDNYIIENPYDYYVATVKSSNSDWGVYKDLVVDETMVSNANEWSVVPQTDGTFKLLSEQATWKGWGWYLGTWSSSEGTKVAAYDGSASSKNPTETTWLCSEPVDLTDVTLSVNATAGWGTFIAPYDNQTPSTVKAYTVSYKNGSTIFFEENETGVLSANTPYVLSTEEASNVSVSLKGIATNDEDTYSSNGLVGLLTASTVPTGSYLLQYNDSQVGFYQTTSDITGTANRCYLDLSEVPTSAPASRATISFGIFGDEITGISSLTPTLSKGEGAVYNLNGQRVEKPSKGLYIMNGKKIMVK